MRNDKLERATDALRDENEHVPADVAQRLQAARRQAVEAADRGASPSGANLPLWGGAGLASFAAAMGIAVMLTSQDPALPAMNVDDLALLATDTDELLVVNDLDVLEDLEFLAWLEQESIDAETRG